jgi:lysophospholipase L1-like esterase
VSGFQVGTSGGGGSLATTAFAQPLLHRALAKVSGGGGDAKLLLVGDSTTWGYGGINGVGPANVMANTLTAGGMPAALGMVIPSALDTRWVAGTGWTVPPAGSSNSWGAADIGWAGAVGAAASSLKFTPGNGYSYDTFDVYYIQAPGFGSVSINIDGGGATVVNTAVGTAGIGKVTLTAAAATNHVLNLGLVTTAAVEIVGVEPSLSTASRLRVGNVGVPGTAAVTWANNVATPYGPLECIFAYAPDVSIINLGINDCTDATTLATYVADITTIANTCAYFGAVILSSMNPSAPQNTYGMEASYTAALSGLAAQYGWGFIDLFHNWGGFPGNAALTADGFYYDAVHPSAIGYADIGRMDAAYLLAS